MIISVPFYAWLLAFSLGESKDRWKNALCFFGACAVCVLILFGYLLSFISISEFVSILGELGKNGDHTVFFSFLNSPDKLFKSLIRIVAILIAGYLVKLIVKKSLSLTLPTVILVMVLSTLLVFFLNVTVFRKSGPFGLLERYLAVILSGVFFVHSYNKDHMITRIFFYGGILYYLGSLMGSNLSVNENAMYLELSVIGLILLLLLSCYHCLSQLQAEIIRYSVFLYIFGIMFFSGYFVRIDNTGPANTLDCTERLVDGPLKHLYVMPEQSFNYTIKKEDVSTLTAHSNSVMILDRNVIYDFLFRVHL